jgi:four helix bundle protein
LSIKNLESLETWCKAQEFALQIYRKLIPLLPPEEKWGLCQQLRRSATSVPANIAEGHGRYYYQDNVRFCYNARGSLEETLSHLYFCFEVEYIPEALYREFEFEGEKLSQLLNGYINYLKRSKQGNNEPGAKFTIHDFQEPYVTDAPEIELDDHE